MNEVDHDRYIQVLANWASPEKIDKLLRKFTPEDLEMLIDVMGSPKEASLFLQNAKKLVAKMLWKEEASQRIGGLAKWIVLVGGAVGTIQAGIIWVMVKWIQ